MDAIKNQVLEIIHQSPLGAFATVTKENKPWVRYMTFMVDDSDLHMACATFMTSRKVEDIVHNQEVHVTFGGTQFFDSGARVQISGHATVDQSKAAKNYYWDDSFYSYFSGVDDPNYGIIVIKPYKVEVHGKALEPEIMMV